MLDEAERKSDAARQKAIAEAAVSVLCLPDAEAAKAAEWAKQSGGRLIDASSHHRVAPGWVYGFPELAPGQREAIRERPARLEPGLLSDALHRAGAPPRRRGGSSGQMPRSRSTACPATAAAARA